jgi:hypothetical protein
MNNRARVELQWIYFGIVAGLWACMAYPVMLLFPLPQAITATLAASFGPALGLASVGLWRMLRLHRQSVTASAAAGLNAIGGAFFTAMVLVQMAVGAATGGHTEGSLQAVWLGLDVAWDAYIGLGTVFFAISMYRHPRFGRIFSISGIVVGMALLFLNLYTFPTPPANAGLVDLGPAVGLWYLAITIQIWRSLRWAREAAGGEPTR